MKYGLLGIDVDGTLLDRDHQLSADVIDAVVAAERTGIKVCLATGRSYTETIDIWRGLRFEQPPAPLVLIGGAQVCEADTGRTLYQRSMPRELACEFADALGEAGYCAMAIIDSWRHGWDYMLAETGDVHAAQGDWFSKMDVEIRRVKHLRDAADMPNPLRINAVADPAAAGELAERLKEQFAGRLNVHAIVAPNYNVTIVEAFSIEANKWNALKYVAQGYRLGPGRVAAVGDDVNDLAMICGAGLGVAMPSASPEIRAAADHVAEGGLAEFIRALADGAFDEDARSVSNGAQT